MNNASVCWHIDWVQYMGFIVLLVMVEGGVVADIFLNRNWKEVYFSIFFLKNLERLYIVTPMILICWKL